MIVSSKSNGVVMYDGDYASAATHIDKYCNALIEMINTYTSTLEEITESAIVDQKITSALAKLSNQTAPLVQTIAEIGEQVSQTSREFVSGVDAADNFLY